MAIANGNSGIAQPHRSLKARDTVGADMRAAPLRLVRCAAGPADIAALSAQCAAPARAIAAGAHRIEAERFPAAARCAVKVTKGVLLLIVPVQGAADIRADGFSRTAHAGDPILLARPGKAEIAWHGGSCGLVLHLSRAQLQAHMSRLRGEPLRVGAVHAALAPRGDARDTLISVLCGALPESRADALVAAGAGLTAAVAGLMREDMFVRSRSVEAAQSYLLANCGDPLTPERVAQAAGVAERTLREAFRDVLGESLTAYTLGVRLAWTQERLASARDGRPISAFARIAGYKSVAAFTRAYKDRFEETPVHTRARAVRQLYVR